MAPVALLIVLVLSFFAWTGLYPGGVADVTQNMWQAAFGGYSVDTDIGDPFSTKKDETATPMPFGGGDLKPNAPGLNILLLFYLLLFIPTLVVTAACVALAFVPPSATAALHAVLPWRWGIVAVLNLILLLFLVLQMVFGFSLENNFIGAAESSIAKNAAEHPPRPRRRG